MTYSNLFQTYKYILITCFFCCSSFSLVFSSSGKTKSSSYIAYNSFPVKDSLRNDTTMLINSSQTKFIGTVTDEISGEPLPFAHILLKNSSVGTVSNSNGNFEFSLIGIDTEDTIQFRYMGYEMKEIAVSNIKIEHPLHIRLNPSSTLLSSVEIVGNIDPYLIIEKAIDNIENNYLQTRYSGIYFFRHKRVVDDSSTDIEEAALDFYDSKGIIRGKESDGKYFQVKQYRKSTSRDKKKYYDLSEVTLFWSFDPIHCENNLLSKNRTDKYKLTLVGKKEFGDIMTYEINFECEKPSFFTTHYGMPAPESYTGTIYIDVETYAIVQYEAIMERAREFEKNKRWLKWFGMDEPCYKINKVSFVYAYKKFENKYFPHLSQNKNSFQFSDEKGKIVKTVIIDEELLNTELNIKNPKVLTESVFELEKNNTAIDKSFWDSFNFTADDDNDTQ